MIWAATIAGLAAGLVHVLSGPDHLAAVAPLAIGKGPRSWRTGLKWALGHSGGVLIIGLLALFFRELLPIDTISSFAEKLVGFLLIGVGAWGICKSFTPHTREPGGAPWAIGAVHGLAGGSHLLGVIPGLLFPSPVAVCVYFLAFAAGTVAGMCSFSAGLGLLPQSTYRAAMTVCSGLAMAIGAYWLMT
jgi:hypothetical protein